MLGLFRYILVSVFLQVCYLSVGAQELIIEGTVTQNRTKAPLSQVNVAVEPGYFGATTDDNGTFTIRLKKPRDYTIYLSYIGYATSRIAIRANDFPKVGSRTIHRSVELVYKTTELPEVKVLSERKPDTLHGTQAYSIADFELLDKGVLLLTHERRLSKDATLRWIHEDEQLASLPIEADPTELYSDYKGNTYVLYPHQVMAIGTNRNQLDTQFLSREDFDQRIRPLTDSLDRHIIYSDYQWYYPRFSYFAHDRINRNDENITTIENDHLMELYRSEYKYLSPRKRLEATRMEYETGIDREEVAALMSDFPNSIYYEPLYAPAFVLHDTILVFDHYSNALKKFNRFGQLHDSVPIFYHELTNDHSKWEDLLLCDRELATIYAVFTKNGYTFLRPVDLRTGGLTSNIKLTYKYVEKVRIKNRSAYYLYRPFGSIQTVYLYKEELE